MRFVAAVLGLAVSGFVYAGSEPPPPLETPYCPQATARHDVSTVADVAGINAGTTGIIDATALNAVSALGAGWVRNTLRWSDIQGNDPDTYDWTVPDANIRNLKGQGSKVLAVIVGTPKWAFAHALGNCNRTGTPALKEGVIGGTEAGCISFQICLIDPACSGGPQIPAEKFWRTFVTAVVNRYSGMTPDPENPGRMLPRVDAWEIWNEPNGGKDKFNGSLVQYHDLVLVPAVDQIRKRGINPTAFLVAPALATNQYFNSDSSITNSQIAAALRDALQGTAAQPVVVDAVSLHSYKAAQQTIIAGQAARQAMTSQFNWPSVPLWLTEYGKNTNAGCQGTDVTCGEADQYCAYRDFQYRNWVMSVPSTYNRAFWYSMTDALTPQGTVSQGYGVLGECTVCAEPCNYTYFSKLVYGEMQRTLGKTPVASHTPFGTP